MRAYLSPVSTRFGFFALALGVLSACANDELILPGEREDIRPADVLQAASLAPLDAPEGARAISLPAQTTNADWVQFPGTPSYRTAHAAFSAAPQLLWSVNIGAGDSRKQRITADPVVGGGRIYTLDAGSQVTAVGPNGGVVWSADIRPERDKDGDATGGGLAYDNGSLYVALGFGEVTALDAATGAVRWRQQLDATGSGSPLVVGDMLYVVAGDDTGWAIRTDTGRVAWQVSATPSGANVLGAPSPILAGGLTVFAFGSGEMIATFPKGGLRRWAATVSGQRLGRVSARYSDLTGAPVVDNGRLYAGNHSGRLVAFNAANGERLWTAREGTLRPVWPAGDSVFAITDRNELIRFDAQSGQIIWRVELPGFVKDTPRRRVSQFANHGPVLAGGRLIVTSSDGVMRSFAPQDGALVGTETIPGGATTGPVFAGGAMYLVNTRGQLLAYR